MDIGDINVGARIAAGFIASGAFVYIASPPTTKEDKESHGYVTLCCFGVGACFYQYVFLIAILVALFKAAPHLIHYARRETEQLNRMSNARQTTLIVDEPEDDIEDYLRSKYHDRPRLRR